MISACRVSSRPYNRLTLGFRFLALFLGYAVGEERYSRGQARWARTPTLARSASRPRTRSLRSLSCAREQALPASSETAPKATIPINATTAVATIRNIEENLPLEVYELNWVRSSDRLGRLFRSLPEERSPVSAGVDQGYRNRVPRALSRSGFQAERRGRCRRRRRSPSGQRDSVRRVRRRLDRGARGRWWPSVCTVASASRMGWPR